MRGDDENVWQTYALDAEDALREIEATLLALESDPGDMPTIHRLYRALHTLKGNSAVLGLERIESLAHAVEDMVGLVRDGGAPFDAPLAELLLALTDGLGTIVREAGQRRADGDDAAIAPLLERARSWTRARVRRAAPEPAIRRGQIVLWSSEAPDGAAPAAPAPKPPDDGLALEIFLALARKALRELCPLLDKAGRRDGEASRVRALAIGEDLRGAAERLQLGEVVTALVRLGDVLKQAGEGLLSLVRLRGELCEALARVEATYRARTLAPQDFGMAQFAAEWPAGGTGILQSLLPDGPGRPGKLPLGSIDTCAIVGSLAPAETVIGSASPEQAGAAVAGEPAVVGAAGERSARPVASQRPSRAAVRQSLRAASARRSLRVKRAEPESGSRAEFLRIDAQKLSLVMDLAGEIALASGAVTHHPELEGKELEGFASAAHKLEVLIRELQNEVAVMRLVPVAGVFQRMQRVVRDTAKRTGKRVELVTVGEETEIDKVMVDALHEPLVHLLRNAIDHGIEPPDERVRLGKPALGKIVLEASHQDGEVAVRVRDDGRGLVRARLLARAVERGIVARDAELTDEQVRNLVFLPGFSTKEAIDEVSGRGVGMDVIKTAIEGLRGRVQLESTEGQGSCFQMALPLTLAFVDAMVVRERDRLFALPIEKVVEVFQADAGQIARNDADGQTLIQVRDRLLPVLWLHRYYGEPAREDERIEGRVIVAVQTSRGGLALPVDRLLGNQPLMLKPLKGVLAGVRAAAGCGMLRTGDVALALDCERLHVV